jgi:tetratricopeptide (TPR) repeat protein
MLLLASVVLLAVAVVVWRAQQRAEVAQDIPARPSTLATRPLLESEVAAAEKRAHGWWSGADGLAHLGRLYQANGFLAEASQVWEALSRLEPCAPRWPYLLGSILAGYGRLDDAQPLLQRVVELAPEYSPAAVRLGEVLLKRGRDGDAAKLFSATLAKDPRNSDASLGLARIDLKARRWPEARTRLTQITAADPDFTPAWALLATVEEQSGNLAAAEAARGRSMNSGLRVMADPWVDEQMEDCYDPYQLNVAAAALARRDSVGAMRLLRRSLEVDANNASSHRLLGDELKKSGDLREARRHFERAAELEPTADVNWNTLVVFLREAGDPAASEQALNRGLSYCPQAPGLLLEQIARYTQRGQFEAAIALLGRLVRLHPDEPEYHVKIALLQFKLDRIPEGMAEMRRTLELKSDHPIALLALARNAVESGDEAGAASLIRRLRQQPQIQAADLQLVLDEYRARFNRTL